MSLVDPVNYWLYIASDHLDAIGISTMVGVVLLWGIWPVRKNKNENIQSKL